MKVRSSVKRICENCGYENTFDAIECKNCGSKRFAPEWVIAKRPITSRTSVDVTLSNPVYGDVTKRITLSKWWPGKGNSRAFHINKPEHWIAISNYVNNELYSIVGWKGLNGGREVV